MKIYAVNIDIEADDPREYFLTKKAAMKRRAECDSGFGEVELLETSKDITAREVVISILNESGWVAKRTTIKADV